jgi:hypothetical protein
MEERRLCDWEEIEDYDGDLIYETSCGNTWQFIEGNLEYNKIKYCPFCGGKIMIYEIKGELH